MLFYCEYWRLIAANVAVDNSSPPVFSASFRAKRATALRENRAGMTR